MPVFDMHLFLSRFNHSDWCRSILVLSSAISFMMQIFMIFITMVTLLGYKYLRVRTLKIDDTMIYIRYL